MAPSPYLTDEQIRDPKRLHDLSRSTQAVSDGAGSKTDLIPDPRHFAGNYRTFHLLRITNGTWSFKHVDGVDFPASLLMFFLAAGSQFERFNLTSLDSGAMSREFKDRPAGACPREVNAANMKDILWEL